MPLLSVAQRRTGRALDSVTVVADSTQTLLCTYLSAVLLVGLLLNATLGWGWADPIAGLVIALSPPARASRRGAGRAAAPPVAGPTPSRTVAAARTPAAPPRRPLASPSRCPLCGGGRDPRQRRGAPRLFPQHRARPAHAPAGPGHQCARARPRRRAPHGHDHERTAGHAGHSHSHGPTADSDRRRLLVALGLIVAFMAVEVIVGVFASSLALIANAGHMLTDATAIGLALVAMRLAARPARGSYTFGLRRAEILSAQANGLTLLLLAIFFTVESIRRLIDPPAVQGGLMLIVVLVGIAVNVAATWVLSKANRASLNT